MSFLRRTKPSGFLRGLTLQVGSKCKAGKLARNQNYVVASGYSSGSKRHLRRAHGEQRQHFSTSKDDTDATAGVTEQEKEGTAILNEEETEPRVGEEVKGEVVEEAGVNEEVEEVMTGGEDDGSAAYSGEHDSDEDSDSDDEEEPDMSAMKPKEIVAQLDKYIVGQADAKKAVAVALRNRWRRKQLPKDLVNEVIPKNILMVGPTGCGKTEVARRLAKLAHAPFIKVEATKYTEIGFHGRDVDSIIRDLMEQAISMVKTKRKAKLKKKIDRNVEKRILDALIGKASDKRHIREFRDHYRNGDLDDQIVNIDVPVKEPDLGGITGAIHQTSSNIMFNLNKQLMGNKKPSEKKRMKIADCRPIIEEMEMERLVNTDDVVKEALASVQEDGIVFLDEIDKICSTSDRHSADASAEGVQRDLLPLIEGSTISTKHGNVETDHILFICSGAFHSCKPGDLLAELQGRLPIRVELKGLTEKDFYRILTEPVTNQIRQQIELMKSEKVNVTFEEDAIKEIAKVSMEVNTSVENIGARRIHTILERVMSDISYDSPEMEDGTEVTVDKKLVREKVGDLLKKADLSKFIL